MPYRLTLTWVPDSPSPPPEPGESDFTKVASFGSLTPSHLAHVGITPTRTRLCAPLPVPLPGADGDGRDGTEVADVLEDLGDQLARMCESVNVTSDAGVAIALSPVLAAAATILALRTASPSPPSAAEPLSNAAPESQRAVISAHFALPHATRLAHPGDADAQNQRRLYVRPGELADGGSVVFSYAGPRGDECDSYGMSLRGCSYESIVDVLRTGEEGGFGVRRVVVVDVVGAGGLEGEQDGEEGGNRGLRTRLARAVGQAVAMLDTARGRLKTVPFCVSDGDTWLPGYVVRDGEPAGSDGGGNQDDPEHWEGRRVRCVYALKRIPVLDRRTTREERAERLREAVGLVLTLIDADVDVEEVFVRGHVDVNGSSDQVSSPQMHFWPPQPDPQQPSNLLGIPPLEQWTFPRELSEYTRDDLESMGVRTGSGDNPELPPLVVDEGLLSALRHNHRDNPETFRVMKRIKLARTCFKDAYEVAVYSTEWVEECIMAAIALVRAEHPFRDATLAPGFCISADDGPVFVPRVDGGPDVPVSARVPYAVFFHDRTPELKEKLLGPHQQVLDTLAAHPSSIVPLLVFPTTGTMIYPFLGDRFHRLPALAAARALIARTGVREVRVCVTDGAMFTFGLLAPSAVFAVPSPWDSVWYPHGGRAAADGLFMYTRTHGGYCLRVPCGAHQHDEKQAMLCREDIATIVGLLVCWMNGGKQIHDYMKRRDGGLDNRDEQL